MVRGPDVRHIRLRLPSSLPCRWPTRRPDRIGSVAQLGEEGRLGSLADIRAWIRDVRFTPQERTLSISIATSATDPAADLPADVGSCSRRAAPLIIAATDNYLVLLLGTAANHVANKDSEANGDD
jgi:hypothetical protein